MQHLYTKMSELVISGNDQELNKMVQQALDDGARAPEVLEKGLLPGMDVVGQRMKSGDMFIPEVLLSGRTMNAALDILRAHFSGQDMAGAGTVIIGTVEGDLHDIGKNLVAMMLESSGFNVIDLGIDVKAQDFVQAIRDHKPKIVGMSALLTTTMRKMQETMDAIKEAGLRDHVKVMAGGAPVTRDFVEKIGADAYGANAGAAVEKAKELARL